MVYNYNVSDQFMLIVQITQTCFIRRDVNLLYSNVWCRNCKRVGRWTTGNDVLVKLQKLLY